MITVNLAAIANQALTIQLDNRLYSITMRETNGIMAATIVRDDEVIIRNLRAVAGTPLLPYRYQEAGNFIFTTEDEEIPYYTEFGITQFLLYVTPAELAEYRGT